MTVTSLLTENAVFPVALTLVAYLFAAWLQKKTKLPFLSPVIVSAALIIPVLLLTKVPVEQYQNGVAPLSFLLTPATICLGLTMYEQVQRLKKNLPAILIGVAAGTVSSLASVIGLCVLLGADRTLTFSLLPKSVTTAIGMVLSEEAGGIPALTAAVIILTGNLGCLIAEPICRLFRITDPVAKGVAYGTAAHVIGTSKALEENELAGAVSGLSLTAAGLMTALLFPLLRLLPV